MFQIKMQDNTLSEDFSSELMNIQTAVIVQLSFHCHPIRCYLLILGQIHFEELGLILRFAGNKCKVTRAQLLQYANRKVFISSVVALSVGAYVGDLSIERVERVWQSVNNHEQVFYESSCLGGSDISVYTMYCCQIKIQRVQVSYTQDHRQEF